MNKENILDKKSLIISRNPNYNDNQNILNKEIIYDIEEEKYYLYDKEKNKCIQTNLLGRKIPKINNAQVGKASYNERIKSQSIEKLNNKIDDSIYHPRMKNFEGFTQIPRPLVPPFNNIILHSKNDILNYLKHKKSIYSTKKFETLLKKKIENISDLDYYSGTISNIVNNKNKNIIIQKINKELNNGNLNKKEVDSLKKFKKNLLMNSNNVINGKKLNEPKDIFQKKYNINYNIIFINPLKESSKNKDFLINLNTYRIMYKSINNNPLTYLRNNIINNLNYNNKIKYINNEKNKIKYKLSRPRSVINIKSNNKLNKNDNSNKNTNNLIHFPKKYEISKNETKRYDTDEDFNNNKFIIKSHSCKDIIFKDKIHSFKKLKKFYKNEKNHLAGYQKPFNKEIPLLRKGIPKYKSYGELYRKELDMFKIVNPEKIKLQENENNRRLNYLKKKIEKDRVVQIVKYKHLIGKKSRINSAISNIGKNYIDI